MKLFGVTDVGCHRKDNQDSFVLRQLDDYTAMLVVCDGMGGTRPETSPVQRQWRHLLPQWRKNLRMALMMIQNGGRSCCSMRAKEPTSKCLTWRRTI